MEELPLGILIPHIASIVVVSVFFIKLYINQLHERHSISS